MLIFLDWAAADDLKILEDFIKYRKHRKMDERTIWLKFTEFQKFVDSVTICRYQEDLTAEAVSFNLEGDGVVAYSLHVAQKTTFLLEVLQEDKIFCSEKYEYSRARFFLLQETDFGLGIGKKHTLIKASSNGLTRSTFCEMRLKPGLYKLVVDIQNKGELFERKYDLILHATNKLFRLSRISKKVAQVVIMETFSNLAIQRGSVDCLNAEKSLRRYLFSSEKIGICVFTYANRSSTTYSIVDKLEVEGDFTCSKAIEHGKIRMTVPSNMKKFIVFRFEGKEFRVNFTDTSVRIRQ